MASDLRRCLSLALLGVIVVGIIVGAPVRETCNYRINLMQPCGPMGTGPDIIQTNKLPLPDMVTLTKNTINVANNLLVKIAKRLDDPINVIDDPEQQSPLFNFMVYHELGENTTACKEENQNNALAVLWQNLLHYISMINYMKRYELYYSGYETSQILRTTTFECDINALEENNLASLLCGFQVVAEDKGVALDEHIFQNYSSLYDVKITEDYSYHSVDKYLDTLIRNLAEDFLLFANYFFECSQLN